MAIHSSLKVACAFCGESFYDKSYSFGIPFCSTACFAMSTDRYKHSIRGVTDEDFEQFRLKILEQMADHKHMEDALPPFDPKSKCAKCGWEIEEPPQDPPKVTKGADGKTVTVPAPPPPPPRPPTVQYCNGMDCAWAEPGETDPYDEHMHQFCDVCGFE